MDKNYWPKLADHIVLHIFSYVSQNDRFNLSLVCKDWSDVFHDPQLWRHFVFKFDTDHDKEGRAIECAEKYSNDLKDVELFANQSQQVSLDLGLTVLDRLIGVKKWKLLRFKFAFTGRNPLCFNGKSILDKVKDLLLSIKNKDIVFNLEVIDLSELSIVLDNSLLNILANYHKYLRVVHIQNQCLIDNITEESVVNLVKSCIYIEEFYAFYHCVDDEVIEVLSKENRSKLQKLSLMCNRSDKFKSMVSSEAWDSLKKSIPEIELEVKFDSTMPRQMVNQILCPKIPATSVDLHIYAWLHEQIHHIAETCRTTLKYFSCHTSLDPYSLANEELPPALLDLAVRCDRLEELHCHCNLPDATIKSINAIRALKASTLYTNRRHSTHSE